MISSKLKLKKLLTQEKELQRKNQLTQARLQLYKQKNQEKDNKILQLLDKNENYDFHISKYTNQIKEVKRQYQQDETKFKMETYDYEKDDLDEQIDLVINKIIQDQLQNQLNFKLEVFYLNCWSTVIINNDVNSFDDLKYQLASQFQISKDLINITDHNNNFILPNTDIRQFFQVFISFQFKQKLNKIKIAMPVNQSINDYVQKHLKAKLKQQQYQEDFFQIQNQKKKKLNIFKDKDQLYLDQQVKLQDEVRKQNFKLKKIIKKNNILKAIQFILVISNIYIFKHNVNDSRHYNYQCDFTQSVQTFFPSKYTIQQKLNARTSNKQFEKFNQLIIDFIAQVNDQTYANYEFTNTLNIFNIFRTYQYREQMQTCPSTKLTYFKSQFQKIYQDQCQKINLEYDQGYTKNTEFDDILKQNSEKIKISENIREIYFQGKYLKMSTYYFDQDNQKETLTAWFDRYTRDLMIKMNFYSPLYQIMGQFLILVSKDQNYNFSVDTKLENVMFIRLEYYEIYALNAFSIVVIVLSCYLLVIKDEDLQIYKYLKISKPSVKIFKKYNLLIPSLFDILNVLIQMVNVYIILTISYLNADILDSTKQADYSKNFYDASEYIYRYKKIQIQSIILLIVNMITLINFVQIFKQFRVNNNYIQLVIRNMMPIQILMFFFQLVSSQICFVAVGGKSGMFYSKLIAFARVVGVNMNSPLTAFNPSNRYEENMLKDHLNDEDIQNTLDILSLIIYMAMNTVLISYLFMVCAVNLAQVKSDLNKEELVSDSDDE